MKINTLVEFNKILNPHKARLIRGPTGIGKSSIVRYVAQAAGARLIDIRLPELEPTDLVGLPYLADVGDLKVTRYAQPDWWPTDPEEKVILFLDELDRASEDMQPIAMQLCLDRRAGGRNLPNNVIVWAACNGEKYMTIPIDQALMDRFAVIDLLPSVDEWLEWARDNEVHHKVFDFIEAQKSRLDTPATMVGKANSVCPSRRSWAELGLTLNNISGDLSEIEDLSHYVRAFVGYADAEAFVQWIKESYQTVSPKDIMLGRVQPTDLSILQISSIIDQTAELFMRTRTTKKHRENCLNFFMKARNEVFAAFFTALPAEAGFIIEKFPKADEFFKSKKQAMLEKKSNA